MSPGGTNYVLECQGPGVPYIAIFNTASNELVRVWKDNVELETRVGETRMAKSIHLAFPLEGLPGNAQVEILIPPEVIEMKKKMQKAKTKLKNHKKALKKRLFDINKKFPLLVYVYGGPGSQEVTVKWDKGVLKIVSGFNLINQFWSRSVSELLHGQFQSSGDRHY